MTSEYDKIRQDVLDFHARVKNWKEDDLDDDEVDEVNTLIEQTIGLLTGGSGESLGEDEDDEFFDED